MRRIFTAVIVTLLLAPSAVDASTNTAVHAALRGALSCESSPLETMRDLADAGSTCLTDGFTGWGYGEEADIVAGVTLHAPLQLAGAQATNVIASMATNYDGFNAYVHAEFNGDFQPVVAELKLRRDPDSGNYLRAMPATGPDDVCPLTIELKPLDDARFLLGCGWCNG